MLRAVQQRERMLRIGWNPAGPAVIVALLGISQIIGYGTLYYSFSILAADIAASFDWPVSWVFGSFSLALLAGGLLAPLVGRRIDRHGAAAVMVLGSALSAAALLAVALAPNALSFTIALVAMQAVSALALYEAAFAALVQVTGMEARQRITHLTLIAGFASTIFWPLTSWLHGVMDWREIFMIFAALNLLVCVPIHLFMALQRRASMRRASPQSVHVTAPAQKLPPEIARSALWLVTGAFALSGFVQSAMLTQMVPLLTLLGLGGAALLVSMLVGPSQVLARFVNMVAGNKRHPLAVAVVSLALFPAAILLLAGTAPMMLGAGAFAVLFGGGAGLKSIVQGTLPLALFGSAGYGTRLGSMAAVRQVLGASAPFAFAWTIEAIGATYALVVLAGIALVAVAMLVEVGRITRRGVAISEV